MLFCWLCTRSEADCMFTPLGSERSAAPADSVIPGLRVCRHVSAATGLSTSLSSLRIGRQHQGLTRGLPHKFLPSPFQSVLAWWSQGSVHWKGLVSALRRLNSGLSCLRIKCTNGIFKYFLYKKAKPLEHVKIAALYPEYENQSATKLCSKLHSIFRACSLNSGVWWHCSDEISVNGLWKLYLNYADVHFFLLPGLEKQYVECVNEFSLPLENSICFSLFTLTHAVFSTAALKACSVIAKAIFKCQTIIDYVKWVAAPVEAATLSDRARVCPDPTYHRSQPRTSLNPLWQT